MIKRLFILIIIGIQLLTLPGCWDYRDIEDLSFSIAGGYDLPDKAQNEDATDNDNIIVSGVVLNLNPDAERKYKVESIAGSTISDTRYKRLLRSSETYIPGMIQVAIFGEDLAKEGVRGILDNFLRLPEIQHSMYLAITEGRAEDLLKTQVKDYPNNGVALLSLLRDAHKSVFIPSVTLHNFAVNLISNGRNSILPILKTEEKDFEGSNISLVGVGVFKKDKLIAKLGLLESRSLFLLRGIKGQGNIFFEIVKNGEKVDKGTIMATNSRKVKVERINGTFVFLITIKLNGVLLEHSNVQSIVENPEMLNDIELVVASDIESNCRSFIKNMQEELKIDCIDINKYALAKWRNELEDQIDDGFIEKSKINVEVEVQLRNIGEKT